MIIREGELETLPGDSSLGFLDHVTSSFNGKVNVRMYHKMPLPLLFTNSSYITSSSKPVIMEAA